MIGLLAQAATESDWISKLLGIEKIASDGKKSLVWHHLPPTWLLVLVIIPAVLGLIYLIYRRERRELGPGPKIFLTAVRSALILIVLFMLFGPVLRVETIRTRRSYVIVLVDDSLSMSKSDPPLIDADFLKIARVTGVSESDSLSQAEKETIRSLTRAGIIKRILQNPKLHILEDLESKLNVQYFTFSNRISSKESKAKFLEEYSEKPIGPETAIGDAMKSALNQLRGQKVDAIVVFSDGKNNAGAPPVLIAQQIAKRYIPIYTVIAGIPQEPKDIALMEAEGHEVALANDEFKLSFKIKSKGFENLPVQVNVYVHPLKEKGKEASTDPRDLEDIIRGLKPEVVHPTTLKGNGEKQPESFTHVFKSPGEYQLILHIDPREGENDVQNNWLTHRLSVRDDKIKVLYVEHPPRYEYRFLKNALIRDTKILCHCLLTSADEGFPQEHTKTANPEDKKFASPIQQFPQTLKDLLEYDVVILGDVDPGKLGGDEVLDNLKTFVSEFGGGLIMISGMASNPRAYRDKTALKDLLPISVEETREGFDHEKIYDQTFGYQLTNNGKKHPITRYRQFANDEEKNLEHWEDRAKKGEGQVGLRWFVRAKVKPQGTTTLVEAVSNQGDMQRFPLFVTQFFGAGRVFWSATDETWLWRYLVGDYPWFYPFWQQAMYWAREGKLLGAKRYRISVDKKRYMVGEDIKIYASAWKETFERQDAPQLTVILEPPGSKREEIKIERDKKQEGAYEGTIKAGEPGVYKIWAGEEDESTRAYDKFDVYIPNREEDEPILDEATLKDIANNSAQDRKDRSQYFRIDEVDKLAKYLKEGLNVLHDPREQDLWHSPAIYLLFAILITIEWVMRKVWRML